MSNYDSNGVLRPLSTSTKIGFVFVVVVHIIIGLMAPGWVHDRERERMAYQGVECNK